MTYLSYLLSVAKTAAAMPRHAPVWKRDLSGKQHDIGGTGVSDTNALNNYYAANSGIASGAAAAAAHTLGPLGAVAPGLAALTAPPLYDTVGRAVFKNQYKPIQQGTRINRNITPNTGRGGAPKILTPISYDPNEQY